MSKKTIFVVIQRLSFFYANSIILDKYLIYKEKRNIYG